MKTVVCDDEKDQATETAARIKAHRASHTVRIYDSAVDLIEDYRKGFRCDLIFLDIRMDDLDGFSAASVFREEFREELPLIVFLTITDKYAISGYGLAWRYIKKPASKDDIRGMLDEAAAELEKSSVLIETAEGFKRIKTEDITYVNAQYGSVCVHTLTGEFTVKGKFEDISAGLPEKKFFKVHRSYSVNFAHIDTFDKGGSDIVIADEKQTQIPLSRRQRRAFFAALANSLRAD
jgi:DNA-binding LytR/AlgR family response regulator